MSDSVRTQIATELCTVLKTMSELKYVNFDEVRMLASDFQDWELPAVQLIDLGDDNIHEMKRARKTWNVTLELVMGSKVTGKIYQKDLWDLLQKIEEKIFAEPRLKIGTVIHMKLLGTATDLHMLSPLYTARMDLQIDYYQPLVGNC